MRNKEELKRFIDEHREKDFNSEEVFLEICEFLFDCHEGTAVGENELFKELLLRDVEFDFKSYLDWKRKYEQQQEEIFSDFDIPCLDEGDKNQLYGLVKKLFEFDAFHTFDLTDLGSAELFSKVFADCSRYNVTAREWFSYDGKVWGIDSGGMNARGRAKLLSRALRVYASQLDLGERELKEYWSFVGKWSTARYRDSVIRDSRDLNCFSSDELDKGDYILNVQNGTLIFDRGKVEFVKHDPNMLLSRICNAVYDPAVSYPRWEKFVDEVMSGDGDKEKYIQKLHGLCLTGSTSNEKMWFYFGSTTRNGKSTLIETAAYILGTYSESIRSDSLAMKQNPDSRTASPDIAKLAGARIVVCSEPQKRMPLDVGLIKLLTGGDKIVARFLHQDEFSFIPKFKLICNTNYLPIVSDATVFSSDRIQVVEFCKHFSEQEQDKELKSRFRTDEAMSGILNWMVQGWLMYCKEGLITPDVVRAANESYSEQSDKLGCFIKECLERKEGCSISIKDAYERFVRWCASCGYHAESRRNFTEDLKARQMFSNRGYIDGKQMRNIIKGFTFVNDGFEDILDDEKLPFD